MDVKHISNMNNILKMREFLNNHANSTKIIIQELMRSKTGSELFDEFVMNLKIEHPFFPFEISLENYQVELLNYMCGLQAIEEVFRSIGEQSIEIIFEEDNGSYFYYNPNNRYVYVTVIKDYSKREVLEEKVAKMSKDLKSDSILFYYSKKRNIYQSDIEKDYNNVSLFWLDNIGL